MSGNKLYQSAKIKIETMTLESFLIANTGLMMAEQLGYFVHNQNVLSHFDLTNDGFKMKLN